MAAVAKGVGNRLVLSPQEPIVGGGAAEALERDLQKLFRRGYRELIVDLSGAPTIDSAGVRALVRGHTSAQRVAGSLRIAGVKPAVRHVLELSRLADVLELYESVEAARIASWPWRTIRVWLAVAAVCGSLVAIGLEWPTVLAGVPEAPASFPPAAQSAG